MLVVGGGGFLALDYNMARQLASKEDDESLTIREYLGGLTGRIASVTGSSGTRGLPTALADMLPRPPEGWTVRPVAAGDLDGFLPKDSSKVDSKATDLVRNVANAKVSGAAEVLAMTYEKGDRRVIIKAVRYPDAVFTSLSAREQRYKLQTVAADYRGLYAMTVRGLDVTEDMLPDGMRGRLFLADVGGQIHLRVLAPKRMPDDELVRFFETLNVQAMNASVVDRRDGLGEVPIIILASALGKADRDAYDADRADRAAADAAESRALLAKADAEVAAAAAQDGTPTEAVAEEKPKAPQCVSGAGGTKRCTVGD